MLRVDHDLAGYVLAGGRSSRMGTDKAFVTVEGKPLLQRVTEAVRKAVGKVTIVGDPGKYGEFGSPVIPDEFAGLGPLAGIHAALKDSMNDWNLIVACDMPGVTAAKLKDLVRIRALYLDADVVLPIVAGRRQPLCAIYRKRLLPAVESALSCGNLKVWHALEGVRVARITFPDTGLFRNINTPEDLHDLQNRAS